jgi:WD40 repeat protein
MTVTDRPSMSQSDPAEEVIFNAARQLIDPERQRRYLDLACEGQPALRRRLARLLGACSEADSFFGRNAAFAAEVLAPAVEHAPAFAAAPLVEGPATKIWRYKLLERIGEGGMGVVYMAEQEEPVRRRVALKIIKLGMDTKQVVARFEAERQALALMDHPNIARVLDGGATENGRPYFVMELIQGAPITEFCNKNHLSAAERIKLFIPVCQAIQSAHQKGIIHRDLKPTNILVTLNDGVPMPKVIDFGVAKATNQKLTEKTLFTNYGVMIGTPAYMSPEQAEMSHLDVDTRADIYGLGVLLYELLTGTTPFPEKRLRSVGYQEMQRIILEEEPERPSARLSTLAGTQRTAVVRNRGASESALRRTMPGDLDWIVMKCLEKDRARRYETANGLARDLERHLNNEPVVACPPSAGYRLQKFVRRNKVAVGATGALALVVCLGALVSTWEAIQAKRMQHYAQRLLYGANIKQVQQAWEQNNLERVRKLLEETADYPERGFEWYYWQRQAHLQLKTLRGHLEGILAAAFSPDGRRIVTGSRDQTAKVWDAVSGKELLTLKEGLQIVLAVAFCPDSRRIATGGLDAMAKVWDATSGRRLLTLRGHRKAVYGVAFSPDGRFIATGSEDGSAILWDATSGSQVRTFTAHSNGVISLAFSPDGARILTGSADQTAKVWAVVTGKELQTLHANSAIWSVAFSPDGRRAVTVGADGLARIWAAGSGEKLFVCIGHQAPIRGVAFSPDGQRIVTGSDDTTAKVWDAGSGRELFSLKGHIYPIKGVAFSPEGGRIVTGSEDGTARIWSVSREDGTLSLNGHERGVVSAAFSPDGRRILTGSADSTAKVWDTASGKELFALRGHKLPVISAAFSLNGQRIVTASGDETIGFWDAAGGSNLQMVAMHSGILWSVAFSPDDKRIVVGTVDPIAKVCDAGSGQELLQLKGHKNGVITAAFSPDGRRIVTGSADGTARVWDSAAGQELLTLETHSGVVNAVAFSPDSQRIVTGGYDQAAPEQAAWVWDAASGKLLFPLKGHKGPIWGVAFSPDGQRIFTGSAEQAARVWDAATGKELLSLQGQTHYVRRFALSPDGRRLVTGVDERSAKVWEAATPSQVAAWQAEEREGAERVAAARRERAAAAESERALRAKDPGAIRQWLLAGPIGIGDLAGPEALDGQQIQGEAQLEPRAGEQGKTGNSEWVWRPFELEDYIVDFNQLLIKAQGFQNAAYAVCYIVSDRAQRNLSMSVGSEDEAKVYLNGNDIYRSEEPRFYLPDQDVVTGVEFKAGWNVHLDSNQHPDQQLDFGRVFRGRNQIRRRCHRAFQRDQSLRRRLNLHLHQLRDHLDADLRTEQLLGFGCLLRGRDDIGGGRLHRRLLLFCRRVHIHLYQLGRHMDPDHRAEQRLDCDCLFRGWKENCRSQ